MTILNKILNQPIRLWHAFFDNVKPFGFKVAWYKMVTVETNRFLNTTFGEYFAKKYHQSVLEYLKKKYAKEIADLTSEYSKVKPIETSNPKIWQCWWQGEEGLKDVTKVCTESVKRNCGKYPVVLITWDNYKDYVKIPSVTIRKYEEGKVSLTELTDIMRMNLLYQNGGLWVDTTVLVTEQITNQNVESQFFTCKEICRNHAYVSDYRWNTSCIGGQKHHPLFGFVAKMFEVYWTYEDHLIDYYLFDYLIELAYQNLIFVKNDIDNLSYNNPHKHDAQLLLNKAFDEQSFKTLLQDTMFFKLSRKATCHEECKGKKTLYKVLKDKYLV